MNTSKLWDWEVNYCPDHFDNEFEMLEFIFNNAPLILKVKAVGENKVVVNKIRSICPPQFEDGKVYDFNDVSPSYPEVIKQFAWALATNGPIYDKLLLSKV